MYCRFLYRVRSRASFSLRPSSVSLSAKPGLSLSPCLVPVLVHVIQVKCWFSPSPSPCQVLGQSQSRPCLGVHCHDSGYPPMHTHTLTPTHSLSPTHTHTHSLSLSHAHTFAGVHSEHRQRGLGTLLLRSLLSHTSHHPHCQVVYLHVLVSNTTAIGGSHAAPSSTCTAGNNYSALTLTHTLTHSHTHTHTHTHSHTEFYGRLGFQELLTIPDYYFIRSKPADGLLFCCYVNGGQPFVGGVRSYLRRYIAESVPCRVLSQLWSYVCHMLRATLQRNRFYSFYNC